MLVACVLAGMATVACDKNDNPPAGGNATAATNKEATNTAPNGQAAPPLGMEDTIEGRVVGLLCYKENPKATNEQLTECSKNNVEKGGYLGILGSDGTLYVNPDTDVRINNSQMKDFIGQEVTVQGQLIGDAPDLSWADVHVKKFKIKLVRRKGPPPPGAQKNMETKGKPSSAPAGPPVPKKNP